MSIAFVYKHSGISNFISLGFCNDTSDYHIRTKRAASRSSAIINFDAINRRQFFSCHMQSARETGGRIWRRIYGAGFCRRFLERVYEALHAITH